MFYQQPPQYHHSILPSLLQKSKRLVDFGKEISGETRRKLLEPLENLGLLNKAQATDDSTDDPLTNVVFLPLEWSLTSGKDHSGTFVGKSHVVRLVLKTVEEMMAEDEAAAAPSKLIKEEEEEEGEAKASAGKSGSSKKKKKVRSDSIGSSSSTSSAADTAAAFSAAKSANKAVATENANLKPKESDAAAAAAATGGGAQAHSLKSSLEGARFAISAAQSKSVSSIFEQQHPATSLAATAPFPSAAAAAAAATTTTTATSRAKQPARAPQDAPASALSPTGSGRSFSDDWKIVKKKRSVSDGTIQEDGRLATPSPTTSSSSPPPPQQQQLESNGAVRKLAVASAIAQKKAATAEDESASSEAAEKRKTAEQRLHMKNRKLMKQFIEDYVLIPVYHEIASIHKQALAADIEANRKLKEERRKKKAEEDAEQQRLEEIEAVRAEAVKAAAVKSKADKAKAAKADFPAAATKKGAAESSSHPRTPSSSAPGTPTRKAAPFPSLSVAVAVDTNGGNNGHSPCLSPAPNSVQTARTPSSATARPRAVPPVSPVTLRLGGSVDSPEKPFVAPAASFAADKAAAPAASGGATATTGRPRENSALGDGSMLLWEGKSWDTLCNHLTKDISRFMQRRGAALVVRRKCRAVLLNVIHNTALMLFPDCKVLPYGSCATGLDLPSSDLDIVVKEMTKKNKLKSKSLEPSVIVQRISLLANALQLCPWAVQVKPIKTASVPLIKMLADPSSLLGGAEAEVVLGFHTLTEHMATLAATPGKMPQTTSSTGGGGAWGLSPSNPSSPYSPAPTSLLYSSPVPLQSTNPQGGFPSPPHTTFSSWRGADIANNLIKVDISFEGPEHGGLMSSAYVAQLIKRAETDSKILGCEPGDNVLIQVTCVLKELLAQKRLNEPFSGGLSSYALILMVMTVVKQAKAKLERQKKERAKIISDISNGKRSKAKAAAATNGGGAEGGTGKTLTASAAAAAESLDFSEGASSTAATLDSASETDSPSKKKKHNNKKKSKKEEEEEATDRDAAEAGIEPTDAPAAAEDAQAKQPRPALWSDIVKPKDVAAAAPGPVAAKPESVAQTPVAAVPAPASAPAAILEVPLKSAEKAPAVAAAPKTKSPPAAPKSPPAAPKQPSAVPAAAVTAASRSSSPDLDSAAVVVPEVQRITVGSLLMHFLHFYGREFNPATMYVDSKDEEGRPGIRDDARRGGPNTTVNEETGMPTMADPLVIINPIDNKTNVARSCFAFSALQWTFGQCFNTLVREGQIGIEAGGDEDLYLLDRLIMF